MSKSTTAKAKEARKLLEEFYEVGGAMSMLWWEKAERLYLLKKNALYKYAYGGAENELVKSWNMFCGELTIPVTTANYMVAVYKAWVIEHKYSKQDLLDAMPYKLHKAIPKLTGKNKEEIKQMAMPVHLGGLSISDFVTEINDK